MKTQYMLATLAMTAMTAGATAADEAAPTAERAPVRLEQPSTEAVDQLQFNFKDAPLDTVLDYMSRAGGFVVIRATPVEGRVDIVSHQPLSADEAVSLLNTVLNEKGYAAIRNGRTLVVVSRDEARQRNIPVRRGNDPESIPTNDEMVTQIIPVRHASAQELIADLQQLLPSYATITANASSNAIVLTDTQASVRRITQIVEALDQSISEISSLRVFQLLHADAKETAELITELFQQQTSSSRGSNAASQIQRIFQGRGGPFGGMAGGGDDNSQRRGAAAAGDSAALQAAARVTAAADERTNSLVVSAPEEMMPTIEELVASIDKSSEILTEVRVFALKHSDAEEMAEVLTDIFGEESQSSNSQPRRFAGGFMGRMMGGQGGPGGAGGNQAANEQSQRQEVESTVVAVADTRTNSVVVSSTREIMAQVAEVVEQLDASPAKNKRVFVHSLKNAKPEEVAIMLQEMFGSESNVSNLNSNSTNNSGRATVNSNLNTRGSGTGGSGSNSSRRNTNTR